MWQVVSAYTREGWETIIIVTLLLAKAVGNSVGRRNVLTGAVAGFVVSTVLFVTASDWADEHIFGKYEGYSGATIGLAISCVIFYHAVRQHESIKEAGFVIAFVLVTFENFEISLLTLGVGLWTRVVGALIAVAVLGVFFAGVRMMGKKLYAAKVQLWATLVLGATAMWLIISSLHVLKEKNALWYGSACMGLSVVLVVFSLLQSRTDKHTAKL